MNNSSLLWAIQVAPGVLARGPGVTGLEKYWRGVSDKELEGIDTYERGVCS